MNEDIFRLYALWTFAITSVHTIIYLIVFSGQYRTAFFAFLGIIAVGVIIFWFRDGGNKTGWQSLDESLLIIFIMALIMSLLMIGASIMALKALCLAPGESDHVPSFLLKVYRASPIALTLVNFINLLIFLARN